jgi:hypothetical protein
MINLQPYLVFKAETTRLNSLYWTSKYSYKRIAGLLKLMADTGPNPAADPRVDQLWGAAELGQSSIATRPLSEFINTLDADAAALRTTSILQVCSAFENALSGYFILCVLYQPLKYDPAYTGDCVPALLRQPPLYEARKKAIKTLSDDELRGKYTERLKNIVKTWGLPPLTAPGLTRINGYYRKRHLIAHDQGLGAVDSPESSAREAMASAISIDEKTWKSMLDDFNTILKELDERVAKQVVTDFGVSLAMHRIISRDGPQLLTELRHKISTEWRISNVTKSTSEGVAKAIGLRIKQVGGNKFQVFR